MPGEGWGLQPASPLSGPGWLSVCLSAPSLLSSPSVLSVHRHVSPISLPSTPCVGCRCGRETWEVTAPPLTSSSLSLTTCTPTTGSRVGWPLPSAEALLGCWSQQRICLKPSPSLQGIDPPTPDPSGLALYGQGMAPLAGRLAGWLATREVKLEKRPRGMVPAVRGC